eukprot:8033156-Alexandrium_andersonii.AAC.1
MSASLVGSEMCLRDRPSVAPVDSGSESSQPEASEAGAVRCKHRLLAPVSYTHLTLPTICSV